MNAWNPDFCRRLYDTQTIGFLSYFEDGRVDLNPPPVAEAIRGMVGSHGADPKAELTRQKAFDAVASQAEQPRKIPYLRPTFGYVAQWVSELGDETTLLGLLKHADLFMGPTWENGGLYYHNVPRDEYEKRDWVSADPYTGNAAIGYARLNPRNGQRKMWQAPWTPKQVDEAPFVDELTFGHDVDVLRAVWDKDAQAMILTIRKWNDKPER